MTNLILLINAQATTLTDDAHEIAVIKLMSSKQEFIVRKLIRAPYIIALEPDLIEILLLQLVDLFQVRVFRTLTGCSEELGALRRLPLFYARSAEVCFTTTAFTALHNDIVAERAFEGLNQVCPAEL